MQMSMLGAIDRHEDLPMHEFVHNYVLPLRPVIIAGAAEGMGATRWSMEMFRARFGDRVHNVKGKDYRLAEIIDLVQSSGPERPAPYLHNALIPRHFPELMPDLDPLPAHMFPNWLTSPLWPRWRGRGQMMAPELFIGGPGATFPCIHWDNLHMHAFLVQISGVKEYFVYPPDQSEFMYAKKEAPNISPISDIESPDLERYPLFAEARPIRFTLHPGEMLFVPSTWWHTVRILTPSITLSINGMNAANWRGFRNDLVAYLRGGKFAAFSPLILGWIDLLASIERRRDAARGWI